ncbi:MAG: sulfite exporter TauE/SafE family protein [Bacteroidetes bacterium]|nr:sulfite exporter TauE/SafE family protein [Bacteroidota bacterium]
MDISIYIFYTILFIVAFLYSSVGHGGASGYLALMTLFSFSPAVSRQTALILNIFVSLVAFYQYYRSNNFNFKLFYPFAITSIPAAFFGGMITLDAGIYKKILAVLILFPVIKLMQNPSKEQKIKNTQNLAFSLIIGLLIGFLSGIIGIGGGILLSPIILLLGWGNMKQTAATSALFIFVNSIAGILGVVSKGVSFTNEMFLMICVAFVGGVAGSYFGALKFDNKILKIILAIVLLIASVKLLTT